jgi:hypothetical protein
VHWTLAKPSELLAQHRQQCTNATDERDGELGLRSVFIKNEDHWASFYRGLVPGRS